MTRQHHRSGPRAPTEAVRAAFEQALQRSTGAPVSIREFHRTPAAYRSSFALEEIDVLLNSGARLAVVFKDFGAVLDGAVGVRPGFVFNPRREIEVYRRILAPRALGPACYGSVADDRAGRYWLFVERIGGRLLWQEGRFATWLQAARWLARMHASIECPDASLAMQVGLLRYDASYYRVWAERALRHRGRASASALLRHVAGRYAQVADRIASLPVSFVHGEFYPSNILVTDDAGGVRVCPVDWEMAGIGPGLLDLAALVSGRWQSAEREEFARAYVDELGVQGRPVDFDDVYAGLQWCRLHVAVQWLGWSERWLPPQEHAHDWLQDVRTLTDTLGL